MFTLPQWIARLTKGYIKYTGKNPDGLAKLKIKMEAAQKFKDQSKVVDFPKDKITDWTKKASGGIAGELHLNEGGRAKFQMGGMDPDYDIDSMRDPFQAYDFGSDYYTSMNPDPFGLDFDKFKAAYGQVAGGGTTSVTPDGQIYTSFGNWDPSNTYANYVQNINRRTDSGNIIPGFTFGGDEAEQKRKMNLMTSLYGAPGGGDPRDKPGYNEARMRGFKPEKADTRLNPLDLVPGLEKHINSLEDIKKTSKSLPDYFQTSTEDMIQNFSDAYGEAPVIGGINKALIETTAPVLSAVASIPYDAYEASQRMEPGSGIGGFFKAWDKEQPLDAIAHRFIGAAKPLAKRIEAGDFPLSLKNVTKFGKNISDKVANLRKRGIDERMARSYKENIQAMADPRMNAPMGAAKGGLAKILGV